MYDGSVPGERGLTPLLPEVQIMSDIESVPSTWDDLRDVRFFRIVCHVLEWHVLEAASSLLAANDADLAPHA